MRAEVLFALRDLLRANFQDFKVIIGVQKNIPQSDYPFIAVIYAGEQEIDSLYSDLKIHIYTGIINKEYDGKVYKGQIEILSVIERLYETILQNPLFHKAVRDVSIEKIGTDAGIQHPIYEAEVILTVRVYKSTQEAKVKRITMEDVLSNERLEVSNG